jgi:hypothetical protein
MFNDPVLTVVNCVLIAGIVAALLASVFIKRGTQALKAENAARHLQDQTRYTPASTSLG